MLFDLSMSNASRIILLVMISCNDMELLCLLTRYHSSSTGIIVGLHDTLPDLVTFSSRIIIIPSYKLSYSLSLIVLNIDCFFSDLASINLLSIDNELLTKWSISIAYRSFKRNASTGIVLCVFYVLPRNSTTYVYASLILYCCRCCTSRDLPVNFTRVA